MSGRSNMRQTVHHNTIHTHFLLKRTVTDVINMALNRKHVPTLTTLTLYLPVNGLPAELSLRSSPKSSRVVWLPVPLEQAGKTLSPAA